jgi:hypothetical protein
MNDHGETYLNLFLFSVGGVHFAIDAEQAFGMTPYVGEVAEDLFWFHEELGFGNRVVTYGAPTVVSIRMPEGQSYRVITDALEDIAEFSRHDIQLFPELLEPVALRNGMWGIVVKDDRLILLVDFKRLLRERMDVTAHEEVTRDEHV